MELDELVLVWKKQDKNIDEKLQIETLRYLLKEKSQGVLSKIRHHLAWELSAISIIFIVFNLLFFLVNMQYDIIRWGCFVLFNLVILFYLHYYKKAVFTIFKLNYEEDLKTNIERIIKSLSSFRNKYKLLNLPFVVLCVVMFAGSQNIFFLVPWMVLEYLLWRSILVPRLTLRFESYKADLDYSLRSLDDL